MVKNMDLTPVRLVTQLIIPLERMDLRERLRNVGKELLLDASDISRKNKVFLPFYNALTEYMDQKSIPISIREKAAEQINRRNLYKKVLEDISEAVSEEVDFMVIKTLKSPTYVGDDVDLFIPKEDEFHLFIKVLSKLGYRIVGYGAPGVTLGKFDYEKPVLVDVYMKISASHIQYIDSRRIWKDRKELDLDEFKIWIPSPCYELLLTIGHSIFKEFHLFLSDFQYAIQVCSQVGWEKVFETAYKENMKLAFIIFMRTVERIYELLCGQQVPYGSFSHSNFIEKRFCRILDEDIANKLTMPYAYPILIPILAYIDKLVNGIFFKRERPSALLSNFLRAPFTSEYGVMILINYLKEVIL